ncbi:MAG: aryl-sulfate sulfotransferase [Flavobacterium sp.]|uniref:aryl-sulfate sulfotransferase n=1 Tax=Flavobacterium sp. TaxID=239 RepID=UPI003BE6B870
MKKYINLYKSFLLLLVVVMCHSCSEDDITDTTLSSIEISTGSIYPEFNPETKDYFITSLNTLKNIQITLNDYDHSKKIYINGVRVQNKITSLKLNIGDDIVIQSGKNNETSTKYTIHYLPSDMPKINVITKNNPSDGYIFINQFHLSNSNPNSTNYIAILNNDGFPVYYKKSNNQIVNFKYFETNTNQKRYSYNDNTLGKIIVMDENFNEIKQLELLPNNGHGAIRTDNHDFVYFNDYHYILPAYVNRPGVNMNAYGGANSVELIDFAFQEIVNGQVIFEWNSANFPEFLQHTDPIYYNQFATRPKVDYFHFNSITIDPNDNNFIVSARHMNQIYKINRTSGQIMWRFGGSNDDFNLTENKIISHPHHATILTNGNLLLFDNGVTKIPKQSRLVEFAIDENNFTATIVNQYTEIGRYFDIMGSAQKLQNGNYFIGWGGNITSQVNANKSDITEVNANGNIVLDMSFSNNPNSFTYSYRALKYNISF